MRKKKNSLCNTKEKEKLEIKRYRNFSVEVVNNGFIATIGCQKLIFKTLLEVGDALKEYWNDPKAIEAKYLRNNLSFNSTDVPPPSTITTGAGTLTFSRV
ncbi:MAG: hypothetical protein WC261_11260 [Synergistaceae bacterium]|jgi:hypothetical protein